MSFVQARNAMKLTLPSLVTSGDVYFVDSVTGSASFDGKSPLTPCATLNQAVAAATANHNDVVYVFATHVETIVGAAGVLINKAGLQIIGMGNGRLKPTFTFTTAAAASFDITSANTTLMNLVFVVGIDNVTAMNNVTAADVHFRSCEWVISDGTFGAAIGILTAATATRLLVDSCRFLGPAVNAGTTCAACIQHESGVDYLISNNYFAGKMTQAIKNVATVLRGTIDSNRFVIGTGTVAITMAAASTPFIVNNRINIPSGTTPITSAAGFVIGNLYSAAPGVTAPTAATF